MVSATVESARLRWAANPLLAASAALLLSIVVFAPSLTAFFHPAFFDYRWHRAYAYLAQVANPFRPDVESVMRWRVLPPLLAHYLGLRGYWAFAIPWLGVLAFITYLACVFRRYSPDPRFVFGATLTIATTSAVVAPIGWLGLNDAWVWLGLAVLAMEERTWPIVIACLLCPWVDERFILGAPLAWTAGRLSRERPLLDARLGLIAVSLLPYAVIRLALSYALGVWTERTRFGFVAKEVLINIRMAQMGWWMAYRAAWAPIVFLLAKASRPRVLTAVFVATATVTMFLSYDQTRSAGIVVTVLVAAMPTLLRAWPETAPRAILALGIVNLLIPMENYYQVNNLGFELYRLLRDWHMLPGRAY